MATILRILAWGSLAGIWLTEWRWLRLAGERGLNRQSSRNTLAWRGSFSCRVEDTPAWPTAGQGRGPIRGGWVGGQLGRGMSIPTTPPVDQQWPCRMPEMGQIYWAYYRLNLEWSGARVTYSQPGCSDTNSCGTPKEGRRTPVPRTSPDARQRHDTTIPGTNWL
jgi:hypothetical protein